MITLIEYNVVAQKDDNNEVTNKRERMIDTRQFVVSARRT